MKWIIGVFIFLDCCYQLFCDPKSIYGTVFYDATHYGAFLAICTYYYLVYRDNFLGVLGIYFIIILVMTLSNLGLTYDGLTQKVGDDSPAYISNWFAILLITIYFIFVSWTKSKKGGR